MKNKILLSSIFSALLISGCSTAPQPSIAQYDTDYKYCAKKIQKESDEKHPNSKELSFAFTKLDWTKECMVEDRGWNKDTLKEVEDIKFK